MLITDKIELVRLKMLHYPSGDVVEYAICKWSDIMRIASFLYINQITNTKEPSIVICALIKNYKKQGIKFKYGIFVLEADGRSLEGDGKLLNDYSIYPCIYSNLHDYIRTMWKEISEETINVNY